MCRWGLQNWPVMPLVLRALICCPYSVVNHRSLPPRCIVKIFFNKCKLSDTHINVLGNPIQRFIWIHMCCAEESGLAFLKGDAVCVTFLVRVPKKLV